jgi:hypothetical protein
MARASSQKTEKRTPASKNGNGKKNGNGANLGFEAQLCVIAHELVTTIRDSVTVDWMHREVARARMRVLVQTHSPQVRLPARPPGRRGADRPAAAEASSNA